MREYGDEQCRNCGEWFNEPGDEYFCPDCRGRFCAGCGEEYDKSELIETEHYGPMCESCLPEYGLFKCDSCGKVRRLGETNEVEAKSGTEIYCDECADDYTAECAVCGMLVNTEHAVGVEIGSGYACPEHTLEESWMHMEETDEEHD